MSVATLADLVDFLSRLKAAKIHYTLADSTDGAVMVDVAVPGERWEIEFHRDGRTSVEVFASAGGVQGSERLSELFRRSSDESS
jgi:hypothetical protein